jgi:hypothetical protein
MIDIVLIWFENLPFALQCIGYLLALPFALIILGCVACLFDGPDFNGLNLRERFSTLLELGAISGFFLTCIFSSAYLFFAFFHFPWILAFVCGLLLGIIAVPALCIFISEKVAKQRASYDVPVPREYCWIFWVEKKLVQRYDDGPLSGVLYFPGAMGLTVYKFDMLARYKGDREDVRIFMLSQLPGDSWDMLPTSLAGIGPNTKRSQANDELVHQVEDILSQAETPFYLIALEKDNPRVLKKHSIGKVTPDIDWFQYIGLPQYKATETRPDSYPYKS